MTRRFTIIIVLLLLGAVANVAVAWGCAFHEPLGALKILGIARSSSTECIRGSVLDHFDETALNRYGWRLREPNTYYVFFLQESACRHLGVKHEVLTEGWDFQAGHLVFGRSEFRGCCVTTVQETSRAGFPVSSLSGVRWIDHREDAEWPQSPRWGACECPAIRFGLIRTQREMSTDFGGRLSVDAYLPWHPIFPGFLINTLLYALLLWLFFFAPFAARRTLRRRRGLCAKCAYPIGVSPVCTECGAAVARKAQA